MTHRPGTENPSDGLSGPDEPGSSGSSDGTGSSEGTCGPGGPGGTGGSDGLSGPGAEQLHEMFVRAADGIVPSPVPLTEITAQGRARRRRRAWAAGSCGLLLAATAVAGLRAVLPYDTTAPPPAASPPAGTVRPSTPPSPAPPSPSPTARVVVPGERVEAAPGVELWLETDGKHWTNPAASPGEQFRSVVDGNFDVTGPNVSVQAESAEGHVFLSGVYAAEGEAARARVVTEGGTLTAKLLHLAHRKWGAWYVAAPLSRTARYDYVRSVTVYDTAGRVLARLTLPPHDM